MFHRVRQLEGEVHEKAQNREGNEVMVSPTLRVLGRRVRPLERIAAAGEILGLKSRSSAYRMSHDWPMVGPESSRWVLMIPLLQRYQIPYTIESDESPSDACVEIDA